MKEQWNEKKRLALVNVIYLATIVLINAAGLLPTGWLRGSAVLQILYSQLLLALPSAYYLWKTKTPYREAVCLHKMKISNVLLTVLFCLLIQPLLTLINGLSMVFSVNTTSSFMLELTEQVPWYLGLCVTALVPAILEESIYRGIFYQEYRKINPWKAAVFSGLLFGLVHGNLNQFCYAFVMGVIFALLLEATGSILSTMIVHFMINAGSVLTLYLLPKAYEMLQQMHQLALQQGQTEVANTLAYAMGSDFSMDASEWLHSVMSAGTGELTLGAVLATYAPQAVLFSVLAFLVLRKIARRSGNWEKLCGMVRGEGSRQESFLTIPMMLALAIGVVILFMYETMMRIPGALG